MIAVRWNRERSGHRSFRLLGLLLSCGVGHGAINAVLYLEARSGGAKSIVNPIQVLGYSKGTETGVEIGSGSGGGFVGTATSKVATLSLTPSEAVTEMFGGLVSGDRYQMKIVILQNGETLQGEASFDDVMFSDLVVNVASGDDVPEVEVRFQYGAMFWTEVTAIDPKSGVGTSSSAGWSFIENRPVEEDFFEGDIGGGGTGGEPPVIIDADQDGLPDAWEDANGMNKNLRADGSEDMDGDSLSNLQEYIAGTDPRSGTSFFLTRIRMATGEVELEWKTVSGRNYRVYEAETLDGGFTLLEEISGAGDGNRIYRPTAGTGPFYRLEVVLAP